MCWLCDANKDYDCQELILFGGADNPEMVSWGQLPLTRRTLGVLIATPRVQRVREAQRIGERAAMVRALLNLPPRQRAVIVLRYYKRRSLCTSHPAGCCPECSVPRHELV
jgi:hypothetical protein